MIQKFAWCLLPLFALFAAPARALDEDTAGYVESNLLAVLYHELGHALIDLMGLPVFGQEEDAADVLNVIMIHELFEEEVAVQIAYDTAFGFLGDADQGEAVFWDVHGPDLQRYYTLVCLFYGGNPDARDDVAQELGLTDARAETCEEEFYLASDSWGLVLDELGDMPRADTPGYLDLRRDNPLDALTADVIETEMAALQEDFGLPSELVVRVEPCGTANAFYDPSDASITICTEFSEYLAAAAPR